MDDIALQARQGSVAAIIQILNEKLADSGVRTRAMFEDGKLQLLCEATTPEQLEQAVLSDRIQSVLESISPRNIRRVNINSRIVQEQQLLWLEEIHRNPETLLWSQEIRLRQLNLVRRWLQDRKQIYQQSDRNRASLPKGKKTSNPFLKGILGGISLTLLLVVVGTAISKWLGLGWVEQAQTVLMGAPSDPSTPEAASEDGTDVAIDDGTPEPIDPFAQAVTIAQQAAADGGTAESAAEWLELAAQWQRAADLMNQVSEDDPRHSTAQNRVEVYQQNRQAALSQAENRQPDAVPPDSPE
jgi:hypothetical protein